MKLPNFLKGLALSSPRAMTWCDSKVWLKMCWLHLIATFDFTTHLNKTEMSLIFYTLFTWRLSSAHLQKKHGNPQGFQPAKEAKCTQLSNEHILAWKSGNPMETHKSRTTRNYYCSLFLLGWRITWVTWLQSQRTLESTLPSHWQPGNEFEVFSQGGLAQGDDWRKDEKEIYRKIEDVLRYHVSQKRSKQKCSKPLVQNTY